MTLTPCADAAHVRRPATHKARLRLKPTSKRARPVRCHVQGAWWPHSTLLADELPSLLEAFARRVGVIDRVAYHQSDWSPAISSLEHQGGDVTFDPGAESPDVVSVFGEPFGRLRLLLVSPYADPSDAYTAMTTAASPGDASTPDQLLGHSARRAEDRRNALIALQRWESDGGAVCGAR